METKLPPIEQWWPDLSIEAKHALQRNLDAQVEDVVIREIEELLSCELAGSHHYLAKPEQDFIRTQTEMVD